MVGAGSVVTRDVPDHGLVWGNPAQLRGFVCHCGGRLEQSSESAKLGLRRAAAARENASGHAGVLLTCKSCGARIEVEKSDWESAQ